MAKHHKKNHAHPPQPDTKAKQQSAQESLPLTLTDKLGRTDTLDTILDHYTAWLPKYQSFSQGRSNFQIEKMIATEHATPAASYQHTLYQLRVLHQSLINDFISGIESKRLFEYKWSDTDQTKPQWWENGKEGKQLCWYDTDRIRHEHQLEELKMSVKDKLLQLDTFTKILHEMEKKHGGDFSQNDLEAEEPEYWRLRIARQMADEYLDRQTGLGTGNLKTLRMATADSPLPDSKNRVENFPDLLNAVLEGREPSLKVLNDLNEELFGHMNNLGGAQSKASLEDTKPAEPKTESAPALGKSTDATQTQSATSKPPTEETIAKLKSAGIGVSRSED